MQMVNSHIREELQESRGVVSKTIFEMLQTYLGNRWRVRITISDVLLYNVQRMCCCCFYRKGRVSKKISSIAEKRVNIY